VSSYLLVYGSLLNPLSASAGLLRDVRISDYIDVTLHGYALSYNVLERVTMHQGVMDVCFLNVVPCPDHVLSAKCLKVSQHELQSLAVREKNYDVVDISKHIQPEVSERVVAFCGKQACLLPHGEKPMVLKEYMKKVDRGVRQFGHDFSNRMYSSLNAAAQGAIIVTGDYSFVSKQQNDLTDCGVHHD